MTLEEFLDKPNWKHYRLYTWQHAENDPPYIRHKNGLCPLTMVLMPKGNFRDRAKHYWNTGKQVFGEDTMHLLLDAIDGNGTDEDDPNAFQVAAIRAAMLDRMKQAGVDITKHVMREEDSRYH